MRKSTAAPPNPDLTPTERTRAINLVAAEWFVALPTEAYAYTWALLQRAPGAAMLPAARFAASVALRDEPRPPVDEAVVESLLAVLRGERRRTKVVEPTAQLALRWFVELARRAQPLAERAAMGESVTIGWHLLRDEL